MILICRIITLGMPGRRPEQLTATALTLAPKVSRPANTVIVPAMTGTYFIKAVDKLGNASTNATSKVAIIEDIKGLNVVETSTQHPAFSGTPSPGRLLSTIN